MRTQTRILGLLAALGVALWATTAFAASIEGTWDSNLGRTVFTQTGAAVKGDLTFANGHTGKIVGVMVGDDVHFSYALDTGQFGTGKLALEDDGNKLVGTYKEQATGKESEWILVRSGAEPQPEPEPGAAANVAGRWDSNLGETVLEQSGPNVTGTLTFANGQNARLEGRMVERTADLTYRLSTGPEGTAKLTLSDDGNTLTGNYRDPAGRTNEWILVRRGAAAEPEPEPATTLNVAGRWNTNIGVVEFTQDGTNVTGTLTFANGQHARLNAVVRDGGLVFSFRHDNGTTGQGRVEPGSDPATMTGSYHDNRLNRDFPWMLRRA